jgi:hypothetical protein
MATGQKLTKKQIKGLPVKVAEKIIELQTRYKTRYCKLYIETPGWLLYLAEATDYHCYRDDKEVSLSMQSARTFHAGAPAQSYQIGRRIEVPQGSWIIEFRLFLGKPIIGVHHVGLHQIA